MSKLQRIIHAINYCIAIKMNELEVHMNVDKSQKHVESQKKQMAIEYAV